MQIFDRFRFKIHASKAEATGDPVKRLIPRKQRQNTAWQFSTPNCNKQRVNIITHRTLTLSLLRDNQICIFSRAIIYVFAYSVENRMLVDIVCF